MYGECVIDAMKLMHQGMTIELDASDNRVRVIETLLFGGPLPPTLPMPGSAAPPAVPSGPIPEHLVKFWWALTDLDRRELRLLADRPYPVAEMETALGLSQPEVQGQHSRMARMARRFKAEIHVRSKGRGRARRRYLLIPQEVQWVRRLAVLRRE